ncbi:prepilin-type N-terminal cleavage/methylation domain-containing protein [Photobacterium sp. SDRW27]|uniref:PilW family protein n=1 Tax=Photobacterium obscurum TaxID=2829490 RepID=UPI002244CC49|nr:prepilin-type N-terminal cleavage/methylation domain-containing protein [Photobacterium obscurum]MCW8331977.1 prepilin-type N-terminal cleavage/methylation domain-containing protein [Photobacterium obscurum]
MVIHNVRNINGFSLIELLIASAIGLLALAVVGSVFINGYSFASQRSLQLMLAQDTNDVLRMIKEDILRAGFASGASSSFIISGATKTIYLNSPSAGNPTCIAYGYDDGTNQHYRSYYRDNQTLRLRSTKSSVLTTAGACMGGQSTLNENQIKVTKFEVLESVLSSAKATSQYLTINLEVATLDDSVSSAKSVQVKTRNWNG